jgi:hypothetical protein
MVRNKNTTNLGLAGLFVLLVAGLIVFSLLLKLFFVFKDSKFDGSHSFIVGFVGPSKTKLVSFNPQSKTLSVVDVNVSSGKNILSKTLEVPIYGILRTDKNITDRDISPLLLKSASPFSNSLEGMTFIDAFELSVFAKNVQQGSIYDRSLDDTLNDAQKATVLSLSFTNPSLYQENLGIQIINASDVTGVGGRLASLITNIGGSPILVTTAENPQGASKIIYYKSESYTVKKLSNYLGFSTQVSDRKGIADITIIIGKDKVSNLNF